MKVLETTRRKEEKLPGTNDSDTTSTSTSDLMGGTTEVPGVETDNARAAIQTITQLEGTDGEVVIVDGW